MRKAQKRQALDFVKLLGQAHDTVKKNIEKREATQAMELLGQCQQGAIELGNLIESTEGEGFSTITVLEEYCELVWQIYEEISQGSVLNASGIYKNLRKQLIRIENSIRNEIKVRYQMVFLPYKASMWDSLESVWMAADADPDCDAYVIPIPYYDRNPDGSFGMMHYEGRQYPDYVPVMDYQTFDLESQHPDVTFIHNPYDDVNYVTSVSPEFYSGNLKKHSDLLVYIPYYSTSGGMSEAQAQCPAYNNADYIIIQTEKYREFFDPALPKEKFVALGSPKFDRVIRLCKNPPEPPAGWAEKIKGKKVYFYNTSLAGMLGHTDAFLKKMRYVFDIFKGREDVCLLWRPHPLLESTFESMRKGFKPQFDALKREFIRDGIGIYDDTPDMEQTIALSDVYIGDSGTSVTSLFGVAGKPLFIMNNLIHSLPEEGDWRGEVVNPAFDGLGNDRYQVTANNQLWFSENNINRYFYQFYMDLGCKYASGGYYMRAIEMENKIYVIPRNAQHLLVIENKVIRKIEFKAQTSQMGAFYGCWYNEKYIFILPFRYPWLIRFNVKTEKIDYIDGVRQFNVKDVGGEWRIGGTELYGDELVFASPVNSEFIFMNIDTLNMRLLHSNSKSDLGTQGIMSVRDEFWLLPLNGMTVTRWNLKTGAVREYDNLPDKFRSIRWPQGYVCNERPFGTMTILNDEKVLMAPYWGNMYVALDQESGKMEEWKLPSHFADHGKNGYFFAVCRGGFLNICSQKDKFDCRIWHFPERRLYDMNTDTKEYEEVKIEFDRDDLINHEPGFAEESEWMQYCLNENAFNSLKDLLDDTITGNRFDKEKQLRAFERININTDGTCGKSILNFIKPKLGKSNFE